MLHLQAQRDATWPRLFVFTLILFYLTIGIVLAFGLVAQIS